METRRLTGPLGVNLYANGEPGARVICVEPTQNVQVEIGPMPREVCEVVARALLMSDEELQERLEQEKREEQARSSLHLPDGVRNGAGPG